MKILLFSNSGEDVDSANRKDVLFVITDGEPRDEKKSHSVLPLVRDAFDYVFVCVIGDQSGSDFDYSGIQGKIPTRIVVIFTKKGFQ